MEIVRSKDLGGSLPVDNVQELASKNLKTIPPRYIRPELDQVSVDESLEIPVIDMSKIYNNDDVRNESMNFHRACKYWGFFQLINHGISEAIEKMKVVITEFFKLPLEEKIKYAQLPNNVQGYGQAFVVSEDQKLEWCDMLWILTQPLAQRDMRFWPTCPSSFRSTLDTYATELLRVKMELLRVMAKNLGVDPDEFLALFKNGVQGMRMNYYPPCHQANKVLGISSHSDATGLTLLVQINDVQGLQIKKNDKWILIKPLPGAIIVNIGDIIEVLSNGEYCSVEHRAMVNPDKERLSIAGFNTLNAKAMVGPINVLVKEGERAKYRSIASEDFGRLALSRKLDSKTVLDQLRINQ